VTGAASPCGPLADARGGSAARIAFFSNDPSRLGHRRRTLKIALAAEV
jgi:hypothetical protein